MYIQWGIFSVEIVSKYQRLMFQCFFRIYTRIQKYVTVIRFYQLLDLYSLWIVSDSPMVGGRPTCLKHNCLSPSSPLFSLSSLPLLPSSPSPPPFLLIQSSSERTDLRPLMWGPVFSVYLSMQPFKHRDHQTCLHSTIILNKHK